MELRDRRGFYEEASIKGTALQLLTLVNQKVDNRQPVPMHEIRDMARSLCENYWERHHLDYGSWFIDVVFDDGSHITFGEDEE